VTVLLRAAILRVAGPEFPTSIHAILKHTERLPQIRCKPVIDGSVCPR
jgi:hypothetical protein